MSSWILNMRIRYIGVPHAHLILLPQNDPTDIISGRCAFVEADQIKYSEKNLPIWPRQQLDEVAAQIRSELHENHNQTNA